MGHFAFGVKELVYLIVLTKVNDCKRKAMTE